MYNKKIFFILIFIWSCSAESTIIRDTPTVHQIQQSTSSTPNNCASRALSLDPPNPTIIRDQNWQAELTENSGHYNVRISGGWERTPTNSYPNTMVLQTVVHIQETPDNNELAQFKSCEVKVSSNSYPQALGWARPRIFEIHEFPLKEFMNDYILQALQSVYWPYTHIDRDINDHVNEIVDRSNYTYETDSNSFYTNIILPYNNNLNKYKDDRTIIKTAGGERERESKTPCFDHLKELLMPLNPTEAPGGSIVATGDDLLRPAGLAAAVKFLDKTQALLKVFLQHSETNKHYQLQGAALKSFLVKYTEQEFFAAENYDYDEIKEYLYHTSSIESPAASDPFEKNKSAQRREPSRKQAQSDAVSTSSGSSRKTTSIQSSTNHKRSTTPTTPLNNTCSS